MTLNDKNDFLSDDHVDAFMRALKFGQPNPSDEDIIAVLQFAKQLVLAAAQLEMVERGQIYLTVDEDGNVSLGLTRE